MGVERRREPRLRCAIPCELRIAGNSVAGQVRNISAGGLGVVAEAPDVDQGDPAALTLRVAGLGKIEVRTLVWHVRSLKRGQGSKAARSFGLVLSDAAPEFAQLVERLAAQRRRPSVGPRTPTTAPPCLDATPGAAADAPGGATSAEAPRVREYRIRLKQSGGSRSYRVVASGVSPEAAAEAASKEVGAGWVVLEVVAIP
jgi:hypothetical protein